MNVIEKAENSPIIIFGSARSNGDTFTAIQMINSEIKAPVIDLNQLNVSYYDYDHKNKEDDFIVLAERMVGYNPIILATPVYWYSMSAIMKTFIDRWSDLLNIRKDIGRRLAGKDLFLITSYAVDLPKGFEDPFSQTCDYLKMRYRGCFYFYSGEERDRKKQNVSDANCFVSNILKT
jgi:putative NADPH-quinone reductase